MKTINGASKKHISSHVLKAKAWISLDSNGDLLLGSMFLSNFFIFFPKVHSIDPHLLDVCGDCGETYTQIFKLTIISLINVKPASNKIQVKHEMLNCLSESFKLPLTNS